MRKSHFKEQFLVLLGPVISRFFACSNEEKNKPRQQSMCALVLSPWQGEGERNFLWKKNLRKKMSLNYI
jgi:hypothetical protein